MDRLLVNFMRSPDTIDLGLLTEVKLKLEYCASLLDQLEKNILIQQNIESILPGKQEDLVVKLQVWLMEGEAMTIKVILQLVVELSLKENTYAKLFVKHDFFSLIYGLMHANLAKDNELTMLCCLILHNLTARERPSALIAQKLQLLLLQLNTASFSVPLLKVLAVQALGMIATYYNNAEVNTAISNFLDNFKWNFKSNPKFTLSPTDVILLLDSNISKLNNLGLWLLAHGEASKLFDWKFVSLQLKSMALTGWTNTTREKHCYHYFHLAVSNVNNMVPGIWNTLFKSNSNKYMNPSCDCGNLSIRGFAEQYIIPKRPNFERSKLIEDILSPINKNDLGEEHSNSDTIDSIEER